MKQKPLLNIYGTSNKRLRLQSNKPKKQKEKFAFNNAK